MLGSEKKTVTLRESEFDVMIVGYWDEDPNSVVMGTFPVRDAIVKTPPGKLDLANETGTVEVGPTGPPVIWV